MKIAFEKSQQTIENKNIEESKKYIAKFIANVFLKEFEVEKEKKIEFKISLTSRMQNFTQEFINFCHKFINTFKSNTDKIIKEFDIKENNQIEHINFIVIGNTGIGKSTFINESLLLSEDKRAKEGVGEPVTRESDLYTSDKLKMIRMWDTQGLDYEVTQEIILNEIKRLVNNGLDEGPDHYINIILYCTDGHGARFQNKEGQLIKEIMNIYPFDNLPVVITQLRSYFKAEALKMEKIIRNILDNYLDHKIVEKIEIKSIVARDYINEDSKQKFKAYGIPELLRLSFDIMGRSISSATCKKISSNIEKLCKDFMEKKMLYVENLFKYEMEILEEAKNLFLEDLEENDEDYFGNEKQKKELSELNIYRNLENPKFFVDNFCKIMRDKFINIFNNLENENMPLDEIKIEKEKEKENEEEEEEKEEEENKEQENNNEQNNINENIQQENIQNENNQQENKKEEEKKEEENQNQEEENQNQEQENQNQEQENQNQEQENQNQEVEEQKDIGEEEKEVKDNPEVASLIEKRLKELRKTIDQASNKTFEKIFKNRYHIYFEELQQEQSEKNREFQDNRQLINAFEIEKNFKEKLFISFKNEFFKIFFCIILKLFMNNLNDNFEMIIKKELTENENVQKIINQKAEISLKNITENLKKNLISELDKVMKAKNEANNEAKKNNEFVNEDIDFAF